MKFKKLYVAFVFLGLIASLVLVYQRFEVEKQYKNYEVTMPFGEIKRLAALSGNSIEEELKEWKEAGLDSVTVNEATIGNMRSSSIYKTSLKRMGCDLYIEGGKKELDFIENGIKETYIGNRKIDRISDKELLVGGNEADYAFTKKEGLINKVEKIGLGYIDEEIQMIKDSGLPLRLRPIYIHSEQDAKKAINRFIDNVKKHSHQHYVVFQGLETFAVDADMDYLSEQFNENDIALGLIESVNQRSHFEQVGLDDLTEEMDFKAVRVFSTWDYIQKRYDYGISGHHHGEEIVNAYFRAITERNVRVIYLKPFIDKNLSEVTDTSIYKARLADLKARLGASPHNIHPVNPEASVLMLMPYMPSKPILQMLIAFGLVACFMMILDNIIDIKNKYMYILFMMGIAMFALIYLLGIKLSLVNSGLGLLSVILYVILASQLVIIHSKKSYDETLKSSKIKVFIKSLGLLVIAILISLTGAVSEVGFYAESRYLLELGIFRGVKLSQLIPIMISFLISLFYFAKIILHKEDMSNMEITKEILNLNVKVWHALAAGIVLLGMLILLLRSGNSSSKPADIELLMRNLLENTLPARPRTKAFIIGYPSLIMLYYFATQKRFKIVYPIFAIFVAVGQANILNTFSHFRTPLYLSFTRVFFEFVVAVLFAIVYIFVIEVLSKLVMKIKSASGIETRF